MPPLPGDAPLVSPPPGVDTPRGGEGDAREGVEVVGPMSPLTARDGRQDVAVELLDRGGGPAITCLSQELSAMRR